MGQIQYTDKTDLLFVLTQIKSKIDEYLACYVEKETGKGLSSNDLTDAMVTAINSISGKADSATTLAGYGITDAKISNGKITLGANSITPITDVSGKANIASPEFTGTPKAPTAAVGNSSTQVANTSFVATAIANALANVTGVKFEKVETLPDTGVLGTIYLLSNGGDNPNIYDEYFWTGTEFELFGTTAMDLSGYVKSADLVAIPESEISAMFNAW